MALHPDAQKLLDNVGIKLNAYTFEALTEASMKPATLAAEDGRIVLDSPYSAGAMPDIKSVPGRKFDPDKKVWTFPANQFQAVYALTMKHFPSSKVQLLKLAAALAPSVTAAKAAKAAGVKSVTFEKKGSAWLVRSPYNAKFVDAIKGVPGRKWVGAEKAWSIPDAHLGVAVQLAKDAYGVDEVDVPPGLPKAPTQDKPYWSVDDSSLVPGFVMIRYWHFSPEQGKEAEELFGMFSQYADEFKKLYQTLPYDKHPHVGFVHKDRLPQALKLLHSFDKDIKVDDGSSPANPKEMPQALLRDSLVYKLDFILTTPHFTPAAQQALNSDLQALKMPPEDFSGAPDGYIIDKKHHAAVLKVLQQYLPEKYIHDTSTTAEAETLFSFEPTEGFMFKVVYGPLSAAAKAKFQQDTSEFAFHTSNDKAGVFPPAFYAQAHAAAVEIVKKYDGPLTTLIKVAPGLAAKLKPKPLFMFAAAENGGFDVTFGHGLSLKDVNKFNSQTLAWTDKGSDHFLMQHYDDVLSAALDIVKDPAFIQVGAVLLDTAKAHGMEHIDF